MKVIGIDPSVNSTGICICNGNKCKYNLIVSTNKYKSIKTQELIHNFNHPKLSISIYNESNKSPILPHNIPISEYSTKEANKTHDLILIGHCLKDIIKKNKPDIAVMEGVSYGSVGHLADLSGLNFIFRQILSDNNIPFIILSPSENKKNATGNGAATKEEMIYAWHACDDLYKDIDKRIKTDDLADAYFLANHVKYTLDNI